LVALVSLLVFIVATVVHFPGLHTDDVARVTTASIAGDADDTDGKALTADHCHCVVAAPWPAMAKAAGHNAPHAIPTAPAHVLATLHLKNDGPPPKA
jgi:hypothetical protein